MPLNICFIHNVEPELIAKVIEAIVVIANRNMENSECNEQINLEEEYGTKIYSIISHEDIVKAMEKHCI